MRRNNYLAVRHIHVAREKANVIFDLGLDLEHHGATVSILDPASGTVRLSYWVSRDARHPQEHDFTADQISKGMELPVAIDGKAVKIVNILRQHAGATAELPLRLPLREQERFRIPSHVFCAAIMRT